MRLFLIKLVYHITYQGLQLICLGSRLGQSAGERASKSGKIKEYPTDTTKP